MLTMILLLVLALWGLLVAWLALRRVRFNNEVRLALLALKHKAGAGEEVFSVDRIAHFPEPARRYLSHAIAEGTRLAASVDFRMEGEIKLGPKTKWQHFSAREVLAGPHGFVWDAGVKAGVLAVRGVDSYLEGEGRMRVWVAGIVPIIDARSADISRSTAGRLGSELAWAPSILLLMDGVAWSAPASDEVVAAFTLDGEKIELHLKIDEAGAVRELFLQRWSINVDSAGPQYLPFGATVSAEASAGGYTWPSRMEGGWRYGTDQYDPFIRLNLTEADFR